MGIGILGHNPYYHGSLRDCKADDPNTKDHANARLLL